jgi:hypothetical protein
VNATVAAITEEIIAVIPPTMLTMVNPVKRLKANRTKAIQRNNRVRLNPGGSRKDATQRYSVIRPPTKKTIPILTALPATIFSVVPPRKIRFVKPNQA